MTTSSEIHVARLLLDYGLDRTVGVTRANRGLLLRSSFMWTAESRVGRRVRSLVAVYKVHPNIWPRNKWLGAIPTATLSRLPLAVMGPYHKSVDLALPARSTKTKTNSPSFSTSAGLTDQFSPFRPSRKYLAYFVQRCVEALGERFPALFEHPQQTLLDAVMHNLDVVAVPCRTQCSHTRRFFRSPLYAQGSCTACFCRQRWRRPSLDAA